MTITAILTGPTRRVALRCAVAALVLTLAACATASRRPPSGTAPAIARHVRVKHDGRIVTVPLDSYAAAVALTELAPGPLPESVAAAIYEVQILVARTYAAGRIGRHSAEGFDLCDTTHCQRYEAARLRTARWAALAQAIATRTSGRVLLYGSSLVDALFHADCGGYTAAAEDVWQTARPYLIAQPDQAVGHREWQSAIARDNLERALKADRRTRLPGSLDDVQVAARDRSGRARLVRITTRDAKSGRNTLDVAGDVFRAVVNATLGSQTLPSTRFRWARAGSGWRVTGTGAGHGVGLCQRGALARARNGSSAAAILGFYYPGVILERAAAR